jgi:PhzF family phenazine biosynthesis protein
MTQGKIEFGDIITGDNKSILLSAIGITQTDLLENCPIQIVSTGHSKVMIGVRNAEVLNSLNPDMTSLSNLSEVIHCNGYFVFTFDTGSTELLTNGRMFAPAIGIYEDPVTGNANGPLGAYLVHHRLVKHDGALFSFYAKQGEAIGRKGTVEVNEEIDNNEPVKVKVAGRAVVVFQSKLVL